VSGPDIPAQPEGDDLAQLVDRLVTIWRGVIGLIEIHPDSHLLDLGVSSLTAVRIRSRIRAELGRDVDLIEFLEHPTPRELAPIVASASAWGGPEPWHQLDWSSGGDAGVESTART
jgi:aryl carrier-like protein